MTIKTYVKSDDGNTYSIDTIEFEGGLWLVPRWFVTPYPQMYKPARMIRMDTLTHNLVGEDLVPGVTVYAIDDPIPKSVLDGTSPSPPGQRFVVLMAPELMIRR